MSLIARRLGRVEELADLLLGPGSAISVDRVSAGFRITVWDREGREPRLQETAANTAHALFLAERALKAALGQFV